LTGSYNYQYTLTGGADGLNSHPQTNSTVAKGQYDGGSCCQTAAEFLLLAKGVASGSAAASWTIATGATVNTAASGVTAACAATANLAITGDGSGNAWGATTLDKTDTAYSSWWCSNGLYKTLTASGTGSLNSIQTW